MYYRVEVLEDPVELLLTIIVQDNHSIHLINTITKFLGLFGLKLPTTVLG